MTDVVEIAKERREIAKERRDALAAEIGRLDDFIRMAEKLVKHSQSKPKKASDTEDEKAAESTGPATARPYSAAADGNGAEAKREDLSVRELEAGERVRKSRTVSSEPAPDRQQWPGVFRRGPT